TTSKQTSFNQEVRLAFPVPQDAPAGAYFTVYKRVIGDDGVVRFAVIDDAQIEGTGANAKVAMHSFPYSGILDVITFYSTQLFALEPDPTMVDSVVVNYVLMWAQDAGDKPRAHTGLVVGRITQPQYLKGQSTPTFVPVEGATVQA